jgi:hypothetical protein
MIMKKLLLCLIAGASLYSVQAQSKSRLVGIGSPIPNHNAFSLQDELNANSQRNTGLQPIASPDYSISSLGATTLGSATNVFTWISRPQDQLSVVPNLNTVAFIHRNNISVNPNGSGALYYTISTDNGANWATNLGLLNPSLVSSYFISLP